MTMVGKYDVVIVGARSAGASTALLLARAGARVLVVDKGGYGTDTLSTHALMRGGVLQLTRWGVLPAIVSAGTPPVRSTTFSYIEQDVTVPIEPRFGVSALYAPRRALLDRLLVDAASDSGAEFAYGVRVDDLRMDDDGRVCGLVAGRLGQIETDFIVGADGLYSQIARLVGAASVLEGQHAGGVLYSYWQQFPVDEFYWRFRPGIAMGVIPTNDDACCIFVAIPSQRFRREVGGDVEAAYNRFLREVAPDFEAKFSEARRVDRIRGFGGHRGFIRTSSGPGWALVGDASYFKDPITAHGITDALRDAELLARAIINDVSTVLKSYESTRLELSRTLFHVTDEIASFARSDAELQVLHRSFSTEMSREVRALAALTPLPEGTA